MKTKYFSLIKHNIINKSNLANVLFKYSLKNYSYVYASQLNTYELLGLGINNAINEETSISSKTISEIILPQNANDIFSVNNNKKTKSIKINEINEVKELNNVINEIIKDRYVEDIENPNEVIFKGRNSREPKNVSYIILI